MRKRPGFRGKRDDERRAAIGAFGGVHIGRMDTRDRASSLIAISCDVMTCCRSRGLVAFSGSRSLEGVQMIRCGMLSKPTSSTAATWTGSPSEIVTARSTASCLSFSLTSNPVTRASGYPRGRRRTPGCA